MAGLPGGPVQAPPRGFIPPAEQAQILADVLAGIELGAWDRQIVQWLANWDTWTAPGILEAPVLGEDGVMPEVKRYPSELRERAVGMVFEVRGQSGQEKGAIARV